MPLRIVTPPTADVVSLAEAKAQLRIDHHDDDAILARIIRTATQALDGGESWFGRALMQQTWDYDFDGFPPSGQIEVPLPPLISVTSVTYLDETGATQTLSSSLYTVRLGRTVPGKILRAAGASWPCIPARPDSVTVRFVAGYGDDADAVPDPIRHAILLMVGHLYENRELTASGSAPQVVPMAYDHLLAPYRVLTTV